MDSRIRRLVQKTVSSGDAHASARLRGELQRLADPSDRLRWQAADPEAQDLVLSVVGDLLGSRYRQAETLIHVAGGERHRIGSYDHLASGVRLHLIPGGAFQMGSELESELERPTRLVSLSPLLIGRDPVVQQEWDRVGGDDERTWRGANLPIEGVTWHQVNSWLNIAGSGLRLPSEAEWEYACRAGTTTRYYWGDRPSDEHAWYGDEQGWTTHPPAAHREKANAFGLVDTCGNVAEWCQDTWISGYKGAPPDGTPRKSRWGRLRVVRGGDSFNPASHCRSARRGMARASDRGAGIGFRAARSVPLWS